MHPAIDLTDAWRIRLDPFDLGEAEGWQDPACGDGDWLATVVPAAVDAVDPAFAGYRGNVWYRREVVVPAGSWQLAGEGIFDRADVWLDGRPLGSIEDPFLPWLLPLPPGDGHRHLLAIRVDNRPRHDRAPGSQVGWRPVGGLLRPVRLEPVPVRRPRLDQLAARHDGGLSLTIVLHGSAPLATAPGLTLRLCDAAGATLRAWRQPGDSFHWDGIIPGIVPWSPETPVLYRLHAEARGPAQADGTDGALLGEASWQIGFRSVAVTDGRITLNGAPLRLCGFNLHEDRADGEFRWHPTLADDLAAMRATGANLVRLCHYPHDPRTLDACDRAGLLVLAEVPLYWSSPSDAGAAVHAQRIDHAERQLSAMIARDRHHPAIIIWSVSNETETARAEVAAANARLVRHARGLDATRLVTHVSNSWYHHADFTEDDLVCLNGYPTWGSRVGWMGPDTDAATWWRDGLARMAAAHPGRPLLVAEFGHPGWAGDEHRQAAAIAVESTGLDHPACAGALVWCWADHLWPHGHPWQNNVTLSPFGVVTRARQPKTSLATIAAVFRRWRGSDAGAMPSASDPCPDVPVRMERLHLGDLPPAVFPDGFAIRPQLGDEASLWTAIQRDAEPLLTIDDGRFHAEYGHDAELIRQRCCIVTGPDGAGIGTIAAWLGRDGDARWGRIHWVAIRPAWQGRGLARAALLHALHRLALWHDRAWLMTSSSRLAAIHLYRSAGFTPCIADPVEAAVWRSIDQALASRRPA